MMKCKIEYHHGCCMHHEDNKDNSVTEERLSMANITVEQLEKLIIEIKDRIDSLEKNVVLQFMDQDKYNKVMKKGFDDYGKMILENKNRIDFLDEFFGRRT